jgi:hypothetical protein
LADKHDPYAGYLDQHRIRILDAGLVGLEAVRT